jgi:hypothetical protein
MTIGRRYELLMAVASRNIPAERRKELLDIAQEWRDADAHRIISHEELFYLFGAMIGFQMKLYCEALQSKRGVDVMTDLGAKIDA